MSKRYGVFLCIHPSVTGKRVVIHDINCRYYKSGRRSGNSKGMYCFNGNEDTLHNAIARASDCALEWHAPIKFCEHCFRKGQTITCYF